MRIPGRTILTACTVALAAGFLAGCTPSHPITEPAKTPKPTPTPVFTSDADALAAATKVYKKYLSVADSIAQQGGKDPERLGPYVSDAGLANERKEAKRLSDARAHQVGATVVSEVKLQRRSTSGVSIYACQDISAVDVLDENGESLVAPSRPDAIPYVATLSYGASGRLIVDSDRFWDGENICQ